MRIVSLLPSATEILCALGLESDLVGITHECDFPPTIRDRPAVTRTRIPADAPSAEIDRLVRTQLQDSRALYSLDRDVLAELNPDLIVTQALCDVCAVAEAEVTAAACSLPGAPRVLNLEPQSLDGVFEAVRQVADATGLPDRGETVVRALQARVAAVADRAARLPARPRVALLEWLDPPFSCGHWSPELVTLAGGVEILAHAGERSRTLSWAEIQDAAPEVIVLACCGFDVDRTLQDVPILQALPAWHMLPAVRAGRVFVIDGSQYFSRPGPRLVDSLEILAHALDPDIHPLPPGLPPAVRVEALP